MLMVGAGELNRLPPDDPLQKVSRDNAILCIHTLWIKNSLSHLYPGNLDILLHS